MSGFLNSTLESASGADGTVLSGDKAKRNIRLMAAALTVLIILIGLFFKDPLQFALGLLLGDVIAQLLFLQNEKSVDKALKDPEKAALITKGGYYLRMLIRGAALVIAYFNPYTSLTGTFLGLMTIPAAIYLLALISGIQMKKKGGNTSDGGSAEGGTE